MYFDSLPAALAMEGHGAYVWGSYLVTVAVIAMVVMAPVLRRRRFLRQLAAQIKRAQGGPAGQARGGS